MTHKKMHGLHIGVMAIAVAAVVALAACQPGVTIQGRIDTFNSQVKNGQYDQLYTNFSSTQTSTYTQIKSASYWDPGSPFASGDHPQAITLTDTSNTSDVKGTYGNANGVYTVDLNMTKSGADWYIATLTLTPVPSGTPFTINSRVSAP